MKSVAKAKSPQAACRLPPEYHEKLVALAVANKKKLGAFMRELVISALDQDSAPSGNNSIETEELQAEVSALRDELLHLRESMAEGFLAVMVGIDIPEEDAITFVEERLLGAELN